MIVCGRDNKLTFWNTADKYELMFEKDYELNEISSFLYFNAKEGPTVLLGCKDGAIMAFNIKD